MYNSRYFTCEQIDQRLLDGFYNDFVISTSYSGTKEQFMNALFSLMNNALTSGNIAGNLSPANVTANRVLSTSGLKSWLDYFKVKLFDEITEVVEGSTIQPFTIYKVNRQIVFGTTIPHYAAPVAASENGYSYVVMVVPNNYLRENAELTPVILDTSTIDNDYKVFDSFSAASSYLFNKIYSSLINLYSYVHDYLETRLEEFKQELIELEAQLENQLDEALKNNLLYINYNKNTGDIIGIFGTEGPISDMSMSPVTGDIRVDSIIND